MAIDPRPVKQCVCFDIKFSDLKNAGVSSTQEARDRFGCGSNCGTCLPYIEEMILTGETEFPVFPLPEQDR